MAIDTYAPCPGGTGKKIKFCCADLVGDLEQLDTLIEGDQISAALDQVKRLEERTPGRACLMATRTKLELASKRYADAMTSSRAFLDAFPQNPLALGQAAVTDAISGRMQEAAAGFDQARERARHAADGEAKQISEELVRIAATLVQAAAQTGHIGFAQGIVDWLGDASLGTEDERRMLAAFVGSSGVPAALRTRMRLEELAGDAAWRAEFDAALAQARDWLLSKALTGFRSLRGIAGESRPLFTNIAIICEMLARPFEASEAWAAVARMAGVADDDAVEAMGRAIALETEADPDRSPMVRFASRVAPLAAPAGEEGTTAIELVEDKIRQAPHFDQAAFDRAQWVSRGAVPPRSAWRVYDDGSPARLLATLLIFGRQTDREPEAILQGFATDIEAARPIVERLVGCTFGAEQGGDSLPATSPTNWLMGSQFRMQPPAAPTAAAKDGPSVFDTLLDEQRRALWSRFLAVWPDTPLPELLGKTPREALRDPLTAKRVEALVTEGEATSRRSDACAAWAEMRDRLGMPQPAVIDSTKPFEEGLPPMRWHRLDMRRLDLDELRGIFVTALDAGFERAAERAAEELATRAEATPADRWEALGVLEDRATSSLRKLEIIAQLRTLAGTLKANDGMLDVAELRVRMQRGDEAEIMRLLEHVRREHSRDQQVLQAFAEVLMEAGVDLSALAGRAGGGGAMAAAGGGKAVPAAGAADTGKLWTPGGDTPGPAGEKKVIWTPT
jgi:hypothetical protein